ncbi:RNA polymerase-binding protein DksA [Azoarcus sp. TTM-91]|uniref:RNA polymerase-binding transcription factor DksA n=1 Tax=Azoarcus indigens TaxID=29545 RepID=A0A4R6DFR6_9RHOO|nr:MULTISPECIES: RNA polymerase-binding protein DksA [Azoarcus]NMG37484.1 RNA polymerase-binding protein DksA [Azoarcus sp. TTM-91]NMG67980.1 RNA polymerase-binding protein DksA [Azoarcus indigens]TDN43320.1 TraR/DksA family transcriptional regulator [Azoarcus indigens]
MNQVVKNHVSPAPPSIEELMEAPEEDYMSDRQLLFFQNRLNQERDALLESAHETTLHLKDNALNADPSDRATQEEDYTLELRVRDRERKQLQRIEQALARIQNGTYGWCEETGEPIGIPRLLARPTTTFSLEAQEHHEARKKRNGG